MRAREAAAAAKKRLVAAGIEDATFEAEYLVRSVAGLSRGAFFADPELAAAAPPAIEAAVARREQREPAPYIAGTREFRGLEIAVGSGVLVPRPETEMLVEIAVAEAREMERPVILDVGTGSGCIAVAVAHELSPVANVVATDVSADALHFARMNAVRHSAYVAFLQADLATSVRHADIVLANLPYISSGDIDALEPEVSKWEPRVALDGGQDGFDLIRRLVEDCAVRLKPRLLALEVGYGMASTAAGIAAAAGSVTGTLKDFAGIDRVVCCRWL